MAWLDRRVVILFVSLITASRAIGDVLPDYYEEPGLTPGRDYLNQTESEYIDPFTGQLKLHQVDLVIPGNGGLDIRVERSYTSRGATAASIFGYRGVNGIGWTLHFGRVVKPSDNVCAGDVTGNILDNPMIELPDGSRRILYHAKSVNASGPLYLTSDRWKADCTSSGDGLIVTSPEGVAYTMSQKRQTYSWQSNEYSWYATQIKDKNGNTINISYRSAYSDYMLIDKVTSPDGRQLTFNYTDEGTYNVRLTSIVMLNGPTWSYIYAKLPVNGDYWQLTSVQRPDGTSWTYAYSPPPTNNEPGSYSMQTVTHPFGGTASYTYAFQEFDNNFYNDLNVVVKTKSTGGPGVTAYTWSFAYDPGGGAGALDITTVTAPGGTYVYRHFGYKAAGAGTVWRIGQLIEKELVGLHLEKYTWGSQLISTEDQFRRVGDSASVKDDNVYVPVLTNRSVTRDGTAYNTTYSNHDTYGNPRTIVETGNDTRRTDIVYLNDTAKWLVHTVKDETIANVGTVGRTFNTNGNMLSLTRFGVPTTFTYHATGDVWTRKDARNITTTYTNYKRGIAQTENYPEGVTVNRSVNDTGTVAWQKNGRGHTTSYTYDGLNRLKGINYPIHADTIIGYSGVSLSFDVPATKAVTRGTYKETTTYDGFGRPIKVTKQDTSTGKSVYQTFGYDALGRKTFVSQPNSTQGTSYTFDILDRTKSVTHPGAVKRTYAYLAGNKVTVTNERGFQTTLTYRSFGNPDDKALIRIAVPEGVTTVIDRNNLDQITEVAQGGVIRTYSYNAKYFLKSIDDPETGTTVFGRDAVGNMTSRTVGLSGTTSYTQDGLNRLRFIDYPDPTPDVTLNYSPTGKLIEASNSAAQRTYTYDENDNLTGEAAVIADKTYSVVYTPTNLDYVKSVTYPSGTIIDFSPDALGRPSQVAPYVTEVGYHPSGQPSYLVYANGRRTDVTLNGRLWVKGITTSGGAVDVLYDYDDAGNVVNVTDNIDPVHNLMLDYDGIDRLTVANGQWGAGSFSYDTTGNLKSKVLGASGLSYTYDTQNRLASVSGARDDSFAYDDYGNIISNGRHLFVYDDAGNLRNVSGPSFADYDYDGRNRRVRRLRNGEESHFVYALNGELLGEYGTGGRHKEYAYLNGKLVAMTDVDPGNITPIANAGADQTVDERATVALDGSASNDPDGSLASYSWTQTGGPAVTLTGANTATPGFTAPSVYNETVLSFRLVVVDDKGVKAGDTVNVTLRDANPDEDADGLRDGWEMQYFGNLAQTADGDPDADGLLNAEELLAGSDPTIARPGVVTGLKAVAGTNKVTLSWNAVAKATSYNLYWSTNPGVTQWTDTKIAKVTTPYVHKGVSAETYYYVATATNVGGESSDSIEVNAAPQPWGPAVTIETLQTAYNTATAPQVAVDPRGNGIAVWAQSDGARNNIWANYYSVGVGWGKAVLIESNNQGGAANPQIAVDGSGNAIAVWRQSDGTRNNIWANRYTAGTGWGTAQLIEERNNGATVPQIAIDAQGDAIAIWVQSDGTANSIYANRYSSGVGWGTAELIETGGSAASVPQIAIGPQGNAIAIWVQSDGTANSIYANRFSPGAGWAGAELIETYAKAAATPRIALDAQGNAIAVWAQTDGTRNNIWANRYTASIGWDTAVLIESRNAVASDPQIAVDPQGNAIAVWVQSDGTANSIYANRYAIGTGWGEATLIETHGSPASLPQLVMDGEGNALATWVWTDNVWYAVWANRYNVDFGWGKALNTQGNGSAIAALGLAMNADGNGLAVWTQYFSLYKIYDVLASRYGDK